MHLNQSKIEKIYNEHFSPKTFVNLTQAFYELADVYNINTLWRKTALDLKREVFEVCIQLHMIKDLFN